MQFRDDIQGLRALAFLSVFIFHLNSNWLPGGFLGVDLFFVLSGYLMTSITISDIEKNKFSIINFYRKRIKRILPAYYVLLLFVTIVGCLFYLYTDLETFFKSLKYSLVFLSNLIFSEGNSYFGANLSENPFLHTWSLAIEMQFYFLLPFVIFFFRKRLKLLFLFLIAIFTIYGTYNIYYIDNKSEMYFSLLARIPEFLIGCLYAVIFTKKIDVGGIGNNILAFFSLVVFLVCCFFINESSYFPGVLSLLPCVAVSNLLVIKENLVTKFFSNKKLVTVGTYSYSLYLWHWPIMAFVRYKNDSYNLSNLDICVVIFLTIVMSWLSYKLVENTSKSLSDKKFGAIYGILFICLGLITIFSKKITSVKYIPELYSQPYYGLNSHNHNDVERLGSSNSEDSILLIGDSHALMLKPFLNYLGEKNNFSFQTLTCDSFIAINGINEDEISNNHKGFYLASRRLVNKTHELIKNSDVIIINSEDFNKYPSIANAIEELAMSINKTQKIILINTFPNINLNPVRFNIGFKKLSVVEFKRIDNLKNKELIISISNKYPNVFFYDLGKSNIFKTPGYINDTVAYYNKNHINTFASLRLAEDLEEDFMKFFNEVRSK